MSATIINGNSLHIPLADNSVQMCVTSPPYFGLRDYGIDGQLGLEQTPDAYVANMVQVFREVWRVLKDDGVLWLNLGDSYASGEIGRHDKISSGNVDLRGKKFLGLDRQQSKVNTGMPTKNLLGIPWRVAFALQADGWYLRSDIIWSKDNPMPESVTDRPTRAHEYIFLLSKQERYFYDAKAIREKSADPIRNIKREGVRAIDGNRNKRSVWTVATHPYSGAKALADYVGGDGKPYKASPDCPIHGHLSPARNFYKESNDAQLNHPLLHNHNTPDDLDPLLVSSQNAKTSHNLPDVIDENVLTQSSESMGESKSAFPRPEYISGDETHSRTSRTLGLDELLGCNLGSPTQKYVDSAKRRNSQKNKTARVDQTIEHDIAFAQTLFDTPSNEQFEPSSDLVAHTHESNTLAHDYGEDRSSQMDSRNAGTLRDKVLSVAFVPSRHQSYCTCEVVTIDHFATFPPKLIEPCILAGSREGDIVLDCFNGAGTSGLVALEHNRRYVGIELNPAYIKLTQDRLDYVQPRLMLEVA